MKYRSMIGGALALAGSLVCAALASAQTAYVPPSAERAAGVYMPNSASSLTFPDPSTGKATVVSLTNGLPVNCILGCGGGGGGGGGDASAANQVITNNRIGDLVVSPAQYSLGDRLKTINTSIASMITALGTPLQAGGSVGISGTLPAFASPPTIANSSFASTTADGADVAQGAVGDAVYAGSGSATLNGILKGVYSRTNALLGYYMSEDAAHVSGDKGMLALCIRSANTYSTTTSSASGDYDGCHTDPSGNVFVAKSDAAPLTIPGATATGTLFSVDTAGWDSVGFQTTGTWAGSVVFEASDDNTNFVQVNVYNAVGTTVSSQTNSTNNGLYSYVAQHRYFRARVSVYTSGTVTATGYLRTGPIPGSSNVSVDSTLSAILAKILAAPSTEAKQDTGNTALAALVTALAPTATSAVTGTFVATGNSSTFTPAAGKAFNLTLYATGATTPGSSLNATVYLTRSTDAGTVYLPMTAAGTGIFSFTTLANESLYESQSSVIYRLVCSSYTSGTVNYRFSQ